MTITSKWEAAKILRREAENIRRHGLTNVFSLSFNCVQAQVLRTEKCEGCLLGDYVREAHAQEAFPCQFIEPDAWEKIDADAGLRERIAARFEWAPQIQNFPSLFQYLQSVLAYLSPPIVALFLVGLFWKRANGHGAFAALMVGFVIGVMGVTMLVLGVDTWLTRIHFLYMAVLMLITCSATMVVVSLLTEPPKEEQVKAYIWTRAVYDAETQQLIGLPWYKNYRVLSLLLLVLTALVVGTFW